MALIENMQTLREHCKGGAALSVGVFDGVHLGHQALLCELRQTASALGVPSIALTFRDHPLQLLAPPYAPQMLCDPEQKARRIMGLGVDHCAMFEFTPEFAALKAEQFLQEIVHELCQAKAIICGPDFHFGQDGLGDIELLKQMADRLGFGVMVAHRVSDGQGEIRSTRVRGHVFRGEVEMVESLLGRPYLLTGVVGEGDKRGRTIGYPTANITASRRRLVPADGVYAVQVRLTNETHLRTGMLNIGNRPTFAGDDTRIEVHIFDYSGDLYGQPLEVFFRRQLRGEIRFEGIDGLVEQLRKDEAECRQWFTEQNV